MQKIDVPIDYHFAWRKPNDSIPISSNDKKKKKM
jgi:hypothetical protein